VKLGPLVLQDKLVAIGIPVYHDGHELTFYLQARDDFWEFPGGKIEEGEIPLNAMKRELSEEMQFDVSVSKMISFFSFQYNDKNFNFFVFLVKLDEKISRKNAQMVNWATLLERKMWDANKVILNDLNNWQLQVKNQSDWNFFWNQVR